jgi:hypothetical protein
VHLHRLLPAPARVIVTAVSRTGVESQIVDVKTEGSPHG